jgi:hypothetical protein
VLLTMTTTAVPATDLGFLLHKHPDRVQEFDRSFGTATVFYPESGEERCTAALLLEVDPIALVRSRGKNSPDFSLSQYVNDRPYAASSLLAVALGDVFRTARAGRCKARPELPGRPMPLEIRLPALPCRGGPELAVRLFEPLGWAVEARAVPLDEGFPEWGDSRYVRLTLSGTVRLADALNHLYVLLPVLDDGKHYWIAPDEVDKLVRAGEGWLYGHPERGLIMRRYLGPGWPSWATRPRSSWSPRSTRTRRRGRPRPTRRRPQRPRPRARRRRSSRRRSTSGGVRPYWRPWRSSARPACSTSVAGRASWSARCWPGPGSPGSPGWTSRRWRSPSPRASSGWTGCPTASGPG